jgi:hypothetical protein
MEISDSYEAQFNFKDNKSNGREHSTSTDEESRRPLLYIHIGMRDPDRTCKRWKWHEKRTKVPSPDNKRKRNKCEEEEEK